LVSRNPNTNVIGYEDLTEAIIKQHTIIVNCTPLGMHPYEHEMPNIPYQLLGEAHLLYDCIYNPEMTRFLRMGQKQGCRVKNGLEMLHIQADRAWEIWRILN
jgi:shikimate dehydrogenase